MVTIPSMHPTDRSLNHGIQPSIGSKGWLNTLPVHSMTGLNIIGRMCSVIGLYMMVCCDCTDNSCESMPMVCNRLWHLLYPSVEWHSLSMQRSVAFLYHRHQFTATVGLDAMVGLRSVHDRFNTLLSHEPMVSFNRYSTGHVMNPAGVEPDARSNDMTSSILSSYHHQSNVFARMPPLVVAIA